MSTILSRLAPPSGSVKTAKRLDLGTAETCNKRSIFQFIHADAEVRTCQLVAGTPSSSMRRA